VSVISLVDGIPGGFLSRVRRGIGIEGYTAPGEYVEIDAALVGPDYFTNMAVPIVDGRDFDARDRDGAPCVAIVNDVFARQYYPDAASAVGRRIIGSIGGEGRPPITCEVVGVIRDAAWQSLNADVRPFFALSVFQWQAHQMTMLVHAAGAPGVLLPSVRRAIHGLDRQVPTADVRTLGDHFAMTAFPFRALGGTIAACGLLALLLATIGIYGIVAHSVAERRRELGLRMALGALERDVVGLVLRDGMRLVGIGIILGVFLGLALARALTSGAFGTGLLFGVRATDAVTFAGVTALLALVALVACLVPARRAARVDPMVSMRGA
jgi:hypothetical protein